MKNKLAIIAVITLIVFSMCFSITVLGGDYDTPIIPVPGNSASQGGNLEDSTGDDWETPPSDVKVVVDINKCSFSAIANRVYSGKAQTPALTVKYGEITWEEYVKAALLSMVAGRCTLEKLTVSIHTLFRNGCPIIMNKDWQLTPLYVCQIRRRF